MSDIVVKKPKVSEIEGDIEPVVTVVYKWKIDESNITSKKTGEVIRSPAIPITDTKHCRLDFYPRGKTDEDRDHASICLRSVKGDFEASSRFYLINYKGHIINPVSLEKCLFKGGGDGFGISEFREYNLLNRFMIRSYADGGRKQTLVIGCELTFDMCLEKGPFFKLESESRLKEFDDFAKLVDNREFSDVILTTKDRKLHAHKNILANKSTVFAEIFTHNAKESEKKVVDIKDVTHDVMKEVLRFIYTGRVNNLEGIAYELLLAANKYSVKGLKKMCESYLIQNINCENVLGYLNFASLHNVSILKDRCMSFFQLNVKKTMLQTNVKVSDLNKDIVDEVCRIIAVSMKD